MRGPETSHGREGEGRRARFRDVPVALLLHELHGQWGSRFTSHPNHSPIQEHSR